MNFVTAVRTGLRKYATFKGTATRPEYWWFVLFSALGDILFIILRVPALRGIWSLALLLPSLAVAVRRNHDAGRSGWWVIAPWDFILLCYPSKFENNKYRDDYSPQLESSVTTTTTRCAVCGKLRLPGQNYCMSCGTKFPDVE